MHKRKKSISDLSMEPPKSAGFFWNRKKHTSSGDKNKKRKSNVSPSAHELFLEYEGFLPPEEPAPASRPMKIQESSVWQSGKAKTSQDSGRASSASHNAPRQSFSGCSGTTAHSRSPFSGPSKRRKKSILSFSRSINEDVQDNTRYDRSKHNQIMEQDKDMRAPSFLRRCMSIRSQGRPQTPSTPLPAYHESLPASGYLPAPVPEFGLVPGFGYETPRPPADLSSGAAARAAAAAQNEILATMRSLSLAEPKINRDSESGVGIEVRDHADELAESEVPIVRQGMQFDSFYGYFVLMCFFRSCSSAPTRDHDTRAFLPGCAITGASRAHISRLVPNCKLSSRMEASLPCRVQRG